ncbi:MAG TPA: hypothetical protein VNW93_05080, partial [Mycobacterium sp.]|nr:hypothetical protein [Mycobacterium sp.]
MNDRTTLYLTDAYGHVLESEDPTGALRFSSYDVAGRVAKEWQPVTRAVAPASGPVRTDNLTQTTDTLVTIHVYDAMGQEVRTISPQTLAASAGVTTPTLIVQTDMTYDAFGEMTRKGVNGGAQEYYEYDQAGRLWRTNSGDGVAKVYLYNLAGKATAEIKSQQLDLSTYADAASVAALSSGVERTETRYDLNGNVLEQRLPYFTQSNPNAGLQQIGAQFLIDNNVLAPSNPAAIYRVYGGDGTLPKFAVVDPGALAGNGGGYYYQAPTAANPAGGWVQDPTYHLVSGRYLHWAQPQSASASATVSYLGTLTAGSSVTATFQYRPSGNPNGTWTTVAVVPLADAEFGIDTGSLADGSYDYKVTYTRPGDVTPYAMATGTMTFAGATATTTDTTAATLAASGVTPVSISQALAVNGAFKDASFRIGDVSARGLDNYVYKKVVTGTLVDYQVDSSATVAAGGGYYLTASGYVQDPNYTPLTSRYVYWNQPSDSTLTATFEYRLANDQSAAWTARAVTALGNGLWGAAIGDLPGGSYDYQVLYSHSGNSTAVATATGTFNLDPVTVQNTLTLTTDPTDDAGFVAPLSNQPPNQISASITSSATPQLDPNSSAPTFKPNDLANLSWDSVGTNQVQVKFPPVKGPVAVEIEYITQPYGEGTNP